MSLFLDSLIDRGIGVPLNTGRCGWYHSKPPAMDGFSCSYTFHAATTLFKVSQTTSLSGPEKLSPFRQQYRRPSVRKSACLHTVGGTRVHGVYVHGVYVYVHGVYVYVHGVYIDTHAKYRVPFVMDLAKRTQSVRRRDLLWAGYCPNCQRPVAIYSRMVVSARMGRVPTGER